MKRRTETLCLLGAIACMTGLAVWATAQGRVIRRPVVPAPVSIEAHYTDHQMVGGPGLRAPLCVLVTDASGEPVARLPQAAFTIKAVEGATSGGSGFDWASTYDAKRNPATSTGGVYHFNIGRSTRSGPKDAGAIYQISVKHLESVSNRNLTGTILLKMEAG